MLEKLFFWTVLISSIVLSIAGVLFAAVITEPGDGGRGGAIADAIALAALFCTRGYAADIYEALTESAERGARLLRLKARYDVKPVSSSIDQTQVQKLNDKLSALEIKLKLDAQGQMRQNLFLAISTVIGTIFWGFGDIFAKLILPYRQNILMTMYALWSTMKKVL